MSMIAWMSFYHSLKDYVDDSLGDPFTNYDTGIKAVFVEFFFMTIFMSADTYKTVFAAVYISYLTLWLDV
jgi:hypothetical protein